MYQMPITTNLVLVSNDYYNDDNDNDYDNNLP